jgi:hypothetical protein
MAAKDYVPFEAFTSEQCIEFQDIILEGISNGLSLRTIRREHPELPAMSWIFKQLAADEAFAFKYARAREAQADALFDEVLEIADDGRNDWMEKYGEDGPAFNAESVARSRVRIDARKWMAGKLRPSRYGERIATEISGPDGGPVQTEEVGNGAAKLAAYLDAIRSRTAS